MKLGGSIGHVERKLRRRRTVLELRTLVFGLLSTVVAIAGSGCGRFGFDRAPAIETEVDGGRSGGDADNIDFDAGPPELDAGGSGIPDAGTRLDAQPDSSGPADAGSADAGSTDARTEDAGMDASPSTGDAGRDTGTVPSTDAGILGMGPFATPRLIAELSDPTGHTDDPTLTADRLELFFESPREGGSGAADLWVSIRATTSDAWGSPRPVAALNSPQSDNTPGVSADGLTIWFTSDRPTGDAIHDFYVSTRASRSSEWSTPTRIAELSSTGNDLGPSVTPDELTLLFHSNRAGGLGNGDLYVSRRTDKAARWQAPTLIADVNTTDRETAPMLVGGGLYLLYGSNGVNPTQLDDLVLASRTTTSDAFGNGVPLDELNSSSPDFDAWISEDLRHVVYASSRTGSFELYESSR